MAGIKLSELVKKQDDEEFLEGLIAKAGRGGLVPSELNQTVVASQVYVGLSLRRSITKLTDALSKAESASNCYTRRLAWATWALVLVTLALVVATLVPVLT